jgi:N-methylhydantoinase A
VSSEILPEIREFERTSTTVVNAYLQPVVGSYLERLQTDLADAGFGGEFLIVASNGGVMTVETARRFPVRTALSGPAAGVIAAAAIAGASEISEVITGDVGGTSFDVAVIAGGSAVLAPQTTIDFGMTIRSPMIEISTIGAGGGSIAWVDRSGLLQVGPESAGGVPGPVCYAMGNDRPTVTDAALVLGRINADRPIGGRARLDVEAARDSIKRHVATPLGLGVDEAAAAILTLTASKMAGALRLVSIERGHEPGRFWLMPFGGGGGLNCCELVESVGLAGALVPRHPGVISALGCVIADMRHDLVRTVDHQLNTLDEAGLQKTLRAAEAQGRAQLEVAAMAFEGVTVAHELDMNYIGQSHSVPTPLTDPTGRPLDAEEVDAAAITECFERAYVALFGRVLTGLGVAIVTARTAVTGLRPTVDLTLLGRSTADGPVDVGVRPVYFDGAWSQARVIDRSALSAGMVVTGPAVLEQLDATTVLPPGWTATVDGLGSLRVTRG